MPTVEQNKENLRKLSQCVYNIMVITDVHSTKLHYFDKKLDQFYTDNIIAGGEKEKLLSLLSQPENIRIFPFKKKVLERNLVANKYKTKEEIRNIDAAEKELQLLLNKIQDKRKIEGYDATTGLEEGALKDYIISLIDSGKKEYSKSLLGIKENEIIKNKEESVFLKKKIKKTLDFDFPKPFEWGELDLKIKDGKENIEIFYQKKYLGIKNYIDLGFSANKKNHKPNRAWELLMFLSVFQNGDKTNATPDYLCRMFKGGITDGIKKGNVYKIKQLLSGTLNEIFPTKDDPFTKKTEYYEPIFTIQPEPILRHDEIWSKRILDGKSREPYVFKDDVDENPYNDKTPYNDGVPYDDGDETAY